MDLVPLVVWPIFPCYGKPSHHRYEGTKLLTKPVPSRDNLIEIIRESGSSHQSFFHYPIKEDGLYLQQNPEEFADFIRFLAMHLGSVELSLDIGVASGGQAKLVRDYLKCKKTIIVDNGEHEMFMHWPRIREQLDTEIVLEMISDSHDPKVRESLKPFTNAVDFAFVDGDHSYYGLRKDIFLVTPLLKDWALMALHDTGAVQDCNRVFNDLLGSPNFTLLRNFDTRFGISVWMRLPRRKSTHWYNHALGWGRL